MRPGIYYNHNRTILIQSDSDSSSEAWESQSRPFPSPRGVTKLRPRQLPLRSAAWPSRPLHRHHPREMSPRPGSSSDGRRVARPERCHFCSGTILRMDLSHPSGSGDDLKLHWCTKLSSATLGQPPICLWIKNPLLLVSIAQYEKKGFAHRTFLGWLIVSSYFAATKNGHIKRACHAPAN